MSLWGIAFWSRDKKGGLVALTNRVIAASCAQCAQVVRLEAMAKTD
jgi:hypothetical protein